jgi:hypothetical protein
MDATLTPEEIQHYERRLQVLETERKKGWESHWKDLARHFLPRRARFLDAGDKTNEGEEKNKLYDGIGIMALRVLANGMQSGLTSPARPWFSLTLRDQAMAETPGAKDWLHDTYEKMVAVFAQSNFYDQIHILYSELACFGTGAVIIEQDGNSTIRCRTLTVGEYCIDAGEDGRVDTIYRRIRMTPRQVVQAWPQSCPENIREMAKRDTSEWLTILHAVEPNKEHKRGSLRGNERPFRSVYLVLEGAARGVLEDSGYYEFPALCPRWIVTASDIYGASPAMDALNDCRQLQTINKDEVGFLELGIKPPLLVGSGIDAKINLSPGGITRVSALVQGGSPAVAPLYQPNPAHLSGTEMKRNELKDQIRRHFHNDLFLMISEQTKNMTATEVAERQGEKLLMLGPVLDRLRSELFQPLIERVYGIMERGGMVAYPPEEMSGQEMKVEFISMLAQAQKQAGISALAQTINFVGQLIQVTQNPAAADKLNVYAAINQFADMQGTQPDLIRSDEEAAELGTQRQQQMQQAQMMALLQQGAEAADKGTRALNNLLPTGAAVQ